MKKNKTKHNPDFFSHAKDSLGKDRFGKAIKKGQVRTQELRLKAVREKLGMNQKDLKGLTQPEASKIEGRKDLKVSTLKKYARSLGMKLSISFVSEEDDSLSVSVF